jgi:hypothetical protein
MERERRRLFTARDHEDSSGVLPSPQVRSKHAIVAKLLKRNIRSVGKSLQFVHPFEGSVKIPSYAA